MSWLKPTILIVALILILLLIASSFIFDFYSKKQLPETSGETVLDVTEEVKITTDNKGVPHVEATNNKDLFFAQGYAQARDRLFQMRSEERRVGKDCRYGSAWSHYRKIRRYEI